MGALAVAWLDRNALGGRVAVDYLRRRGVAARIRLTRLDAGGAEGSVALGSADHPTLVAPRFAAEFARDGLLAAPRLSRLQLDGPRLAIGFDGRRIDFGALQPLVDAAMRAPKAAGPSPRVRIAGGQLALATPGGTLHAGVDAELADGRLTQASLSLRPTTLGFAGAGVEGARGQVSLRTTGEGRYAVQGELAATAARTQRLALDRPRLHLHGEAPGSLAAGRPAPLWVRLDGEAKTASATGAGSAEAVRLKATLQGEAAGPLARAAFHGRGSVRLDAASFGAPTVRLAHPTIAIDLGALDAEGGRLSARGALNAGAPQGRVAAAGVGGVVHDVQLAAQGRVGVQPGAAPSADLQVAMDAAGGLDPTDAAALARGVTPGALDPQLRHAIAQALGHVRVSAPDVRLWARGGGWRLDLTRPMQAAAAGGVQASLSGRGRGWALRGDGRGVRGGGVLGIREAGVAQARLAIASAEVSGGRARAQVQGELAGGFGPAREVRAALAGRLDAHDGGVALTLDRCAPLGLGALQGPQGGAVVVRAALQACPLGTAPLASYRRGVWALAANLRDGSGEAPGAKLALSEAAGEVRLTGRGRALSGEVRIGDGVVADTGAPQRFGPIRATGVVRLSDEGLAGGLDVALARPGTALGRLTLDGDLRRGEGQARLSTPTLLFAPNGLQPAAILPGLAGLGSQVKGPVQAKLAVRWGRSGVDASAQAHVDGVQLKTAAGLVTGLRTDLALTRLYPLTSAPDQKVYADRLAAVLPLTDISADYALGGDSLALGGAKATLAGGRIALDPMRVPLQPGGRLDGVLRVQGVDLATVLDALNLSQALSIQAKMAGTLPFSFGPSGLRIADGRLAAVGPGRLTFKRKALTGAVAAGANGAAANATMQDFAFQALEDLAFTELDASVASRPQGRLGVVFHVRGRHDPPKAEPARIGLFDLLRGHAFDKPLPLPKGTEVNLTLDSSLNLDDLLGLGAARAGSGPVHRP